MNHFVTNNIEKLQKLNSGLEWVLLPPNVTAPVIEPLKLQQFVQQYQEFTPVNILSSDQIWRIVVLERASGEIIASVRVIVSVKQTSDSDWANDIIRYGGVGFEDDQLRQIHVDTIELTARSLFDSANYRIAYVGEMVVRESRRRSWMPVLLACGIHSVSKFCGCDFGLAFANRSNNADKLFLKMGGFELRQANGQPLPTFNCTQLSGPGRLIGLRAAQFEDGPLQSIFKSISNSMQRSLCEQGATSA